MARAIRHSLLRDGIPSAAELHSREDYGSISQHLRNHVHLTNCIHLKHHMHRRSPILAERSLMRDLIVMQRSRSLRDPSTSPPSWLSPSVISALAKKSGKDAGIHGGRRSIGIDRVGDVARLSVSSSRSAAVDALNAAPAGTSGNHNARKIGGDDELSKVEIPRRSNHGEKDSHLSAHDQHSCVKTLSKKMEEVPTQSDNDNGKPSRLCQNRAQQGGDKRCDDMRISRQAQSHGMSRLKRRKFKSNSTRRVRDSVDSRTGRVHNDTSVASTTFAQGFMHHGCSLEEETEELEHAEMDAAQVPRNGCGIPWNWSRIHHSGKTFLDIAGRSLSCGLSESRMRKTGGSVSQSEMDNSKIPMTSEQLTSSTASDLEVLPLLMEPSGSPENNVMRTHDCPGELGIYTNLVSQARSGNLQKSGGYSRHRFLTQKFMPKTFKDLVGQNLVVQALSNAIARRKVGLVYVFYGPQGTGKTSCAHVFAKALNCQSSEHPKPCDVCTSCISHNLGKTRNLLEVGPVSTFGNEKIRDVLNGAVLSTSSSQSRVFIVDDCDSLGPDSWMTLSKLVDHAPRHLVFIFVSLTLDNLPHVIISRCQKFYFPKLKESDIIHTLQCISASEGLEIEKDALKLIASRSDGSLRDAEMTLDQLSLLGQRISLPLVQELVGLVSDERLVDLLDAALSADTVNTIKSLREIIETGVEPLALMSQLATLITDILAGTYLFSRERQQRKFFCRSTLSKEDMGKLRQALRTLSEAEKQLRVSSDKLTWLIAALLQIVPDQQYILPTSGGATLNQSPFPVQTTDRQDKVRDADEENEAFGSDRGAYRVVGRGNHRQRPNIAIHGDSKMTIGEANGKEHSERTPEALVRSTGDIKENLGCKFGRSYIDYGKIWRAVIDNIPSDALRQFLSQEGRLNAVSFGAAPTVQLVFSSPLSKCKAEKVRVQILQAFESVINATVILEIRCESQIGFRQEAQVPPDITERGNSSSQMTTNQQSIANQRSFSSLYGNCVRWITKENSLKRNTANEAGEIHTEPLAIGRDHKGKVLECSSMERSSSQHFDLIPVPGREGSDVQNYRRSLVRRKVSLAHVIQQAEGFTQSCGWSGHKSISIADKLEQENLKLESQSRSLLCWKSSSNNRTKLPRLKLRTRKPRSILKFVICGRCFSSRSAR
ncbi:hypothetical protein AXF42_Ash002156 [Apostasia shenzhenica]|uniref:AAA+ ATPase domain-containing protein n=1 Tax=Apostasia shenzhenica TaxID=1088818 RepID=A0A2I0AMT0_9ASPA|nr:hypothetical protein AXF42_Ash002156 [Apostasia shenzhenica]